MTIPRSVLCPVCGSPRKRYMRRKTLPNGQNAGGTFLFCNPCNERKKKEREARVWGRALSVKTIEEQGNWFERNSARAHAALTEARIWYGPRETSPWR